MRRWLSALLTACLLMTMTPGTLAEDAGAPEAAEAGQAAAGMENEAGQVPAAEDVEAEAVARGELELGADGVARPGEDIAEPPTEDILSDGEMVALSPRPAQDGAGVPIDKAHFPDPAFRDYLKDRDGDLDGRIADVELFDGERGVCIEAEGIRDLRGIGHFTALKRLYICAPSLTTLDLRGCSGLERLTIESASLASLDIAPCPELYELQLRQTRIASLYIGDCPNLLTAYTQGRASIGQQTREYDHATKIVDGYRSSGKPIYRHYTLSVSGDVDILTDNTSVCEDIELPGDERKAVMVGDSFRIALTSGKVKSYSSSSGKVASVSKTGKVKALKEGVVKIKVTLTNKKKYGFTLIVNGPTSPADIHFESGDIMLGQGKKVTLSPVITAIDSKFAAKTKLTWKSKDPKIAAVDSKGRVTGKKGGRTTITVTTSNRLTASVAVTVQCCRALLIGEVSYAEKCPRNKVDVKLMNAVLTKRKGPEGGKWNVKKKYDRSAGQIRADIRSFLGEARDDDISLFFFAGHGEETLPASDPMAGAIACTDAKRRLSMITTSELADWLGEVRGKVIVIVGTCGSGALIYRKDGAGGPVEAGGFDPGQFNRSLVDAFRRADEGVDEPVTRLGDDGLVEKVGEFRRANKFYVLTATAFRQPSWGNDVFGNFFPNLFKQGVGTASAMPADRECGNGDGLLTLKELYTYLSENGDDVPQGLEGETQQVQVYPANSGFVMFAQ